MKKDPLTGNRGLTPSLDRRTFLRTSALGAGATIATMLQSRSIGAVNLADSPIATTKSGRVRGYTDNGINVFKGIRYGADTKSRRFMPALPPDPWTEIRETVAYGPASPQQSRSSEQTSEDCLFLNIWTPGLRDGQKRQ